MLLILNFNLVEIQLVVFSLHIEMRKNGCFWSFSRIHLRPVDDEDKILFDEDKKISSLFRKLMDIFVVSIYFLWISRNSDIKNCSQILVKRS